MALPIGILRASVNKVICMHLQRPHVVRSIHSTRHLEKTFLRFDRVTGERIKEHPETPAKGEYEVEPPKGKIYDKKPFKFELTAGKIYFWCTCGQSHRQPFCDSTHKKNFDQSGGIKFQPHRFKVEETKEYWLCNCKQTDNRPFCDGTHKRQDIQDKRLY